MSKRKKSKLWLVLLVLAIIAFSPIFLEQQRLLLAKGREMSDIKHKITDETKTQKELQKQKSILNTDEYTEKVAREKFGMIKPGEKVFVDVNK